MRLYLSFILLFTSYFLSAQDDYPYHFRDYNYVTNVKSVKFHNADLELSYPFTDLGSGFLTLNFDDTDGDIKNYRYKIIHCDADWTPSDLTPFDYVDRFEEGPIVENTFSQNTFISYTNYNLTIPNNDVRWTISGNYLLIVFDDDEENPVITRRFVVVEPLTNINVDLVTPNVIVGRKTHHEIDFIVDHEGVNLRSPISTIKATILQNGRWDNAIEQVSPISTGREVLNFDHNGKIVFPAGKEWRPIDLQGFVYPVPQIIVEKHPEEGYYITNQKDFLRGETPYQKIRDLNGSFVIRNKDFTNQLRAEYGEVLFRLSSAEYESKDVYLFSEFTNWEIHEDFKLVYNPSLNAYVTRQQLKQGYYDYAYAFVDKETKAVDFKDTEGNWFETDNTYTILLYYRPVSARFTRVIGGYSFFSTLER